MFEPSGIKRNMEEFIKMQKVILDQKSWVVEGCSSKTFEMRFAMADLLIYFHLPRYICFARFLKRLFNYKRGFGGLRTINWGLLKYTFNFDKDKGKLIEMLRKKYPSAVFYEFKKPKEVEAFLTNFKNIP